MEIRIDKTWISNPEAKGKPKKPSSLQAECGSSCKVTIVNPFHVSVGPVEILPEKSEIRSHEDVFRPTIL